MNKPIILLPPILILLHSTEFAIAQGRATRESLAGLKQVASS